LSGSADGTMRLWALPNDSKRPPSFAILAPTAGTPGIQRLRDLLADQETQTTIPMDQTLKDALESEAEVLIRCLDRQQPFPVDPAMLESLKRRKVIGIGYGAAQLFQKLNLEINDGACAHSSDKAPRIQAGPSPLLGKLAPGKGMVAFQLQDSSSDTDWNFAMFIPENSPARSVVDVVARWEGNRNYAPLVRQGNYLLVGLAAPEATWTPEYRQFFRQLALALRDRKPELFTEAKWEITKPGRDYRFELGKARETNRLFGQTYYFQ